MNVKTVITLILGLVFQLAQVPGAVMTNDCRTVSESCECCTSGKSCHCAENGDAHQKPSPVPLVANLLLKAPAARSGETGVSWVPSGDACSIAIDVASPPAGLAAGYRGVRLSVAFCSFVI